MDLSYTLSTKKTPPQALPALNPLKNVGTKINDRFTPFYYGCVDFL